MSLVRPFIVANEGVSFKVYHGVEHFTDCIVSGQFDSTFYTRTTLYLFHTEVIKKYCYVTKQQTEGAKHDYGKAEIKLLFLTLII